MKKTVTFITILLTAFALSSAEDSRPKSNVRVPDVATALSIAELALIKVYGKRQINSEMPLNAMLNKGVWNVYGTLYCSDGKGNRTSEVGKCAGGVASTKIRQRDGKILVISYTK